MPPQRYDLIIHFPYPQIDVNSQLTRLQNNGNVADRVKSLNENARPIRESHIGPIPNTAQRRKPFITGGPSKQEPTDLFHLPVSTASSVKNGMKGKAGSLKVCVGEPVYIAPISLICVSKCCMVFQADFAGQPSKFFSAKENTAKQKRLSPIIELPLEAWTYGTKLTEEQNWIGCDGERVYIKRGAASTNHIVTFKLRDHIGGAQVSDGLCCFFGVIDLAVGHEYTLRPESRGNTQAKDSKSTYEE